MLTSTASGYSFSENGNYPYQSDNQKPDTSKKNCKKRTI